MSEEKKSVNPIMVNLEAGKSYAWCACGKSKSQPFCDGSHSGTGVTPLVFKAEKSEQKALCVCKNSKNKPWCDGSHMED